MGAPKPGNVRNVVLVGQGGVGKTSLAEAMLHLSGKTARLGGHDGTKPTLDYDPEEVKRAFSISTFLTLPVLGAPMMTSLQGRAQCATPTGRVRGRCRPGSSMVGSRADSPSKCPMPPPYPHGRPSMHTFRRTYEYRRREEETSL